MRDADRRVRRAARTLADRLPARPRACLTLGSGLAPIADAIADPVDVAVAEVADLPGPTAAGHAGFLRFGDLGGVPVLAQVGRVHLYEGRTAHEVTRVVEVAAELGCTNYVVTNASGGLRDDLQAGDLATIGDHLNLTGASPLAGSGRGDGHRFVDLGRAYDPGLRRIADESAATEGIDLREVVYAGVTGPAYETPAEARMLRTLGADVVGMSTVLEVTAAVAHGMRVLGLTVVTNVHRPEATTGHATVVEVAEAAAPVLERIVKGVLAQI